MDASKDAALNANMVLYNQLMATPSEARKKITGGRLNGLTDINPMWRIKRLTEVFGPFGQGWKYEITSMNLEAGAGDEIAAFVTIAFYYKIGTEWSIPIPGLGGSMFVSKEKSGLRTNDEAFKMALTDAIGSACKTLGMSADIYFANDRSKYTQPDYDDPSAPGAGAPYGGNQNQNQNRSYQNPGQQGPGGAPFGDFGSGQPKHRCTQCGREIIGVQFPNGGPSYTAQDLIRNSIQSYGRELCYECCCEAGRQRANGHR